MNETLSPRARRFIIFVDRIILFITRHWLALAIAFLAIFYALPILAPTLMYAGITAPADLIYRVYSFTCHQLAYRSFFLFGAHSTYTVGELQHTLGVTNDAADAFFWRSIIGDSRIGYKMAWCARETGIYAAMILTFSVLGLLRARVPRLDWRVYILVFVLPMAIDGGWQLLTSPLRIVPFLPVHESTALNRVVTGALFGIGSVWLVFPYIAEAMRDAYTDARYQYERARERERGA